MPFPPPVRCAPEASVIAQGKNDSLRARAILRSLVPLEDLQGVLSLRFNVLMPGLQGQAGMMMQQGMVQQEMVSFPNKKQIGKSLVGSIVT